MADDLACVEFFQPKPKYSRTVNMMRTGRNNWPKICAAAPHVRRRGLPTRQSRSETCRRTRTLAAEHQIQLEVPVPRGPGRSRRDPPGMLRRRGSAAGSAPTNPRMRSAARSHQARPPLLPLQPFLPQRLQCRLRANAAKPGYRTCGTGRRPRGVSWPRCHARRLPECTRRASRTWDDMHSMAVVALTACAAA